MTMTAVTARGLLMARDKNRLAPMNFASYLICILDVLIFQQQGPARGKKADL